MLPKAKSSNCKFPHLVSQGRDIHSEAVAEARLLPFVRGLWARLIGRRRERRSRPGKNTEDDEEEEEEDMSGQERRTRGGRRSRPGLSVGRSVGQALFY